MDVQLSRLLLAKAIKVDSFKTNTKFSLNIQKALQKKHAERVSNLGLPEGECFDPKTFQTYLSKYKMRADYSSLTSKTGNYGDYLAIYCDYENCKDFKNKASSIGITVEEANALLEERLEIPVHSVKELENPFSKADYIKRPPFVKLQSEYEALEMGSRRIRVNCISFSLYWATDFLVRYARKIEANDNVYRYILTEYNSQNNFHEFEELFNEVPAIKDRIEIKTLYGGAFKNTLQVNQIAFPLYNDIVIYEEYNENTRGFKFLEAIIGITPIDPSDKYENFSICIETQRGNALNQWFRETWKKIERLEFPSDVDS